MIDTTALDAFLIGTAYLYVNDIAGAVIAIGILVMFILQFRSQVLERISNV